MAIQTYRGIRFVQMEVNDDDEKDRLRFGMDEPDAWVRCDDRTSMNMMRPVVMATSPDWDRTESEDDGLRFYDFSHEYLAEVDEIDLDWHDGTENHGRHAAALKSSLRRGQVAWDSAGSHAIQGIHGSRPHLHTGV